MDVGSITPATRDLLQALNTRKKTLALLPLLDDQRPEHEAARLDEIGVAAFAFATASETMQRAARSTKSVPALCLPPLRERQASLVARWHGADGVCVDAALPADEWASVATEARSTRMLVLGTARDAAQAAGVVAAGARGLLLPIHGDAAEVLAVVDAVAGAVPRGTLLVAHVAGADAALLRALRGRVDAAVAPPEVHRAATFADLQAELEG